MISKGQVLGRYALFAVLATVANILAQEAGIWLYRGAGALMVSLLAGTGTGFIVKYVLDKQFVFFDTRASAAREAAKIVLYGVTAVATTLIFWSMELGFFAIWHTAAAKYAGAVIGLGIGYATKYALDRRFVFTRNALP